MIIPRERRDISRWTCPSCCLAKVKTTKPVSTGQMRPGLVSIKETRCLKMAQSHVYSLRAKQVKNVYYWWKLWCKWTTLGRTRDKTYSPREIIQRNSWTTWKRLQSQCEQRKRTRHQETKEQRSAKTAKVYPALASRGFPSHVFLVITTVV